jgi:hypothetical protein
MFKRSEARQGEGEMVTLDDLLDRGRRVRMIDAAIATGLIRDRVG